AGRRNGRAVSVAGGPGGSDATRVGGRESSGRAVSGAASSGKSRMYTVWLRKKVWSHVAAEGSSRHQAAAGLLLGAVDVLAGVGIDADPLAGRDEFGNADGDAVGELGRLGRGGFGCPP